ncbi:MAG: nucleoside triphosphate pyrophosphatase [Oligoflexales bacterium]
MKHTINYIQLASTSSARRSLMNQYHIPHHCSSSGIKEATILANTPTLLAHKRAQAKALSISGDHPQALILGADQTAEVNGQLLTKARNEGEARSILKRLNGQDHTLHSAFALAYQGHIVSHDLASATMSMRNLNQEEQETYLTTQEWEGCVGCYRIEGLGAHLFESIGDQTTVMGLPILRLLKALRILGINLLTQPQGPWKIKITD